MTLTSVPTYELPEFVLHEDATVAALLLVAYHRGELGIDATHVIADGMLRIDPEQSDAGIDDIAELLDKAEDYDGDPLDAIHKHYGMHFSGPADAFADTERDKARADARLAAELLVSLARQS